MKKKILVFLTYVLTALLACVLTCVIILRAPNSGYDKLDQLQQLIENNFVGEYDTTELQDAAASGMIQSLGDRWSYYIPADEYAAYQMQMKNQYVGIGVTVQRREDNTGLDIIAVTPGGSAQQAGILVGDIVVAVDGESIVGQGLNAVKEKIQGQEGTSVTLGIQREGNALDFTIKRMAISTPVATAVLLENGIGIVTIENFDGRCASETIAAIEQLRKQGADKLIFDVRNNPGGYKSELVEVLDYLLPEGLLFHSQYTDGEEEKNYSDAACVDLPMAVLVNRESYSAAEFFAAALSEYRVAQVVGEKTCGKGYFQVVYPLKDGSAAGISIGKYFTPKGISLEGKGITPDVAVDVDDTTFAQIYYNQLQPEADPQIQAAVAALLGK